jgi:hypothetical protein
VPVGPSAARGRREGQTTPTLRVPRGAARVNERRYSLHPGGDAQLQRRLRCGTLGAAEQPAAPTRRSRRSAGLRRNSDHAAARAAARCESFCAARSFCGSIRRLAVPVLTRCGGSRAWDIRGSRRVFHTYYYIGHWLSPPGSPRILLRAHDRTRGSCCRVDPPSLFIANGAPVRDRRAAAEPDGG